MAYYVCFHYRWRKQYTDAVTWEVVNYTSWQKIENGVYTALEPCQYSPPRESYVFAGWATEYGSDPVYGDEEEVYNLAAAGESVNLYAVFSPVMASGHRYIMRPLMANATGMVDGDTTDIEEYAIATDMSLENTLHIYSVDDLGSAGEKTVTQNGVYEARDDSWGGYSKVTVQVPVPTYVNADLKRY